MLQLMGSCWGSAFCMAYETRRADDDRIDDRSPLLGTFRFFGNGTDIEGPNFGRHCVDCFCFATRSGQPAFGRPVGWCYGFYAFGLIALLYLVTEESLVEAHEIEDRAFMPAAFFIGFVLLIYLEELL